jgi:hypothetical protein
VDDLMWLGMILGLGVVGFLYIRLLGSGDEGAGA